MIEKHIVSALGKTWILDLDGTIVKHNGYKLDGKDSMLPGALDFMRNIPDEDKIIFLTSRERQYSNMTEQFLKDNEIRYDHIIYDIPFGERILVNDRKPSGLQTAIAVNTMRDIFMEDTFEIDADL